MKKPPQRTGAASVQIEVNHSRSDSCWEARVAWLISFDRRLGHTGVMSNIVTQAELADIVADLRAMAAIEPRLVALHRDYDSLAGSG